MRPTGDRHRWCVQAIDLATGQAAANGVEVAFAVADATVLAGYDACFDTILDSALYHTLGPAHRKLYLAAARRASRTGAWLNSGVRGGL